MTKASIVFWLIALLVWVSAGGRIGRVLVRPASTVRMAIIVAVAAVAAASTAAIPDVAQLVDSTAELKVYDPKLSDVQAVAAWVMYVAATCVIAFAAWPIASRTNLRRIAVGIYGIGIGCAVLSLWISATFGWIVVALGSIFIALTGLRNLAWNPLGRGIGIYTIGALVIGFLAFSQIYTSIVDGAEAARHPRPVWAWEGAAIFIAVGAVWILVEVWIRARLLMRRLKPLHATLVERFPEVVTDDAKRSTTVLRASDQVAHIMDALYLQSGGGSGTPVTEPPPSAPDHRAAIVAQWAHDPRGTGWSLDPRWIAAPEGTSTRRWVGTLAKEYRTLVRN